MMNLFQFTNIVHHLYQINQDFGEFLNWTRSHLERCDRNLVWLNDLQVLRGVVVVVGFLTVTGAKKRVGGEKGGRALT